MVIKKCPVCKSTVRAERSSLKDENGRVRHAHVFKDHKVPSGALCTGSGREAPKEKNRSPEADLEFDLL